jgi:hypothetical protein
VLLRRWVEAAEIVASEAANMRPSALPTFLLCALVLCTAASAKAEPDAAGAAPVAQALAACTGADLRPAAERRAALSRALAIAEGAIADDDRDAAAHFAVFCTLGRAAEIDGVGLASFATLRRLQREIDRTLDLAPEWPDALAAKAAMLLRLPGWLGGDTARAEQLARRAVARAPDLAEARDVLAQALAAQAKDGTASGVERGARADDRSSNERAESEAIALLGRLERELSASNGSASSQFRDRARDPGHVVK